MTRYATILALVLTAALNADETFAVTPDEQADMYDFGGFVLRELNPRMARVPGVNAGDGLYDAGAELDDILDNIVDNGDCFDEIIYADDLNELIAIIAFEDLGPEAAYELLLELKAGSGPLEQELKHKIGASP